MEVVDDAEGSVRVVATELIPAKTKLGPYEAKKTTQVIEAEDGFLLRVSMIHYIYNIHNTNNHKDFSNGHFGKVQQWNYAHTVDYA